MVPGRTRLTVSEIALLAFGKPHYLSDLHALNGLRDSASCLRQAALSLRPALGRATNCGYTHHASSLCWAGLRDRAKAGAGGALQAAGDGGEEFFGVVLLGVGVDFFGGAVFDQLALVHYADVVGDEVDYA